MDFMEMMLRSGVYTLVCKFLHSLDDVRPLSFDAISAWRSFEWLKVVVDYGKIAIPPFDPRPPSDAELYKLMVLKHRMPQLLLRHMGRHYGLIPGPELQGFTLTAARIFSANLLTL